MADAVLNGQSLLLYTVPRLGAHALARTARGARLCRRVTEQAPDWMHALPGMPVIAQRADRWRPMRWFRASANVAGELLKFLLITGAGASLGGDEGYLLGAECYLGLAGIAHGIHAGIADHDRRAVRRGEAEQLVRTRRANGETEEQITAWIATVGSTPTRGSFGWPRLAPSRRMAQALGEALRTVLEEERATERAQEKRRRQTETLHRLVDEIARLVADDPAGDQIVTQARRCAAQADCTTARRQLHGMKTALLQRRARAGSRPPSPDPQPPPPRSHGAAVGSLRLRQLIKNPPPELRPEDLRGAGLPVTYEMTEDVFAALAADYAANRDHRANIWRAFGHDPSNGRPWQSAGPGQYTHRIGRLQLVVATTEDDAFQVVGLQEPTP